MPKQLLPLALLLCLLAACGASESKTPEPPAGWTAFELPNGLDARTLGDHLLDIRVGPHYIYEMSAFVDEETDTETVDYGMFSTADDSVGHIHIWMMEHNAALLQVQISAVFENDNSIAEAIMDPSSALGLLMIMEGDLPASGNGLIFSNDGNLMLETTILQILEDLGLDEALCAEAKERFLDVDWAENDGILEVYLGDFELRRLFVLPDGDTPGSIDFYIIPVTKQT